MLKAFKSRLFLLLSLALISASFSVHAQLQIEITRGQANATPIAIVPLGWDAATPAPFDVSQVVENDLRRSGQFAPLERRDMIERPTAGADIRFPDWKYLKSDYIMVGKLLPDGADRYQVQYELYNVLNGQSLIGERISSSVSNLRATAHRVADRIYEKLTGVRGAFSTRIAFLNVEGEPSNRHYKLIVADADGENQRVVADSPEPIMSPAWSPDGLSLAYVSFESKNAAIYVQTLSTGERRRVSASAGINGAPAWSPDGRMLAVTLSRKDGDVDVYTRDLLTQLPTRMTYDSGIDTEPAWSPDGKKLYFTSDRSGGAQIYVADVTDPRSPRRVTFDGSYNARPRISPDGKKLAMIHRENGNDRIAVFDLSNNALQVLTNGRDDESPSFAPNGSTIIYATQERGRGVLMTVSVDGRVQQKLTTSRGDVREPVWGPFAK